MVVYLLCFPLLENTFWIGVWTEIDDQRIEYMYKVLIFYNTLNNCSIVCVVGNENP